MVVVDRPAYSCASPNTMIMNKPPTMTLPASSKAELVYRT